ncbi:HAD family hydrolase [Amnibacterium flavum]|uniref:Hydrolase n=1 Tax=Amnibacterium flavum TaxID=2173173 RepID=A0A2V1HUH4_9MICO|nr:HAD family phosphatase [Amnibacterium flavum]PVZ94610.1 hydrolase [Amnibacterium flavum]
MTSDLPSAVLWDMDGTLVDSEPYWFEAQSELIESFGGSWTDEEALELVGAGLWVTADTMQRKGIPWDADRIVDHLTDEVMVRIRRQVPWRPGARELLASARAAGVPCAMVTMSIRRMAELVAESLSVELADDDLFVTLVTGDEVTEPKPHPEAYLLAAELLEVDPSRCVAIEDSPTGAAAAVAAGAATIGVPHIVPITGSARLTVWPTLEGRTVTDLADVLAGHSSRVGDEERSA